MRQETINIYKFDELSAEAQEKAICSLSDINVSLEWWDFVTHDAEIIGVKIESFDIYRHSIDGHLILDAEDVANHILRDHGPGATRSTAEEYLSERDALVEKYSDGKDKERVAEGNEAEFDEDCDDLDSDFADAILQDYLSMLRQEYEWLTSDEAIKDTIIANEYEFTEDGQLY
jgi:hypothetical protein